MSNNLQSLHDFPQVHIDRGDQVVEYTFLNIESTSSAAEKSIQLSQDTLTSVYDWFSSCLNRPANGSEIYAVAKQLYVSGRYAQATACILLFRGHLECKSTEVAWMIFMSFICWDIWIGSWGTTANLSSACKKCTNEGIKTHWQRVSKA